MSSSSTEFTESQEDTEDTEEERQYSYINLQDLPSRAVGARSTGFVLYHNEYSYFSQKVAIALLEKKIEFQSFPLNLTKGQQYSKWYLHINPRGEVPTLQIYNKVVRESGKIIDFLEENYSKDIANRLIPVDRGKDVIIKVKYFRNLLDKLPVSLITMGSLYHPEYCRSPKMPFIRPMKKVILKFEETLHIRLKHIAEENPQYRTILLQKAGMHESKIQKMRDTELFLNALNDTDSVLEEIEEQLSDHRGGDMESWLCTDRFTVADISLCVFLHRLRCLGLSHRYWGKGKRPYVTNYYERIQKRESFRKCMPNIVLDVVTIIKQEQHIFIGILIAVLAILFFVIYLFTVC